MKPAKRVTRRLSDMEIDAELRKLGPSAREQYVFHRNTLIDMLDVATDDSQEQLAGFLFAVAALSNEIARRYNYK